MDGGLLEYFDVFLLVFARMGGMVFINPVFSRKGVPFMVRTGLVLALSMLIAPAARSGAAGMISFSTFDMAEALIREVALGVGIHEWGTDSDFRTVCKCILFPVLFCHGLPSFDSETVCLYI